MTIGVPRALLIKREAALRLTGLDARDFDAMVGGILPRPVIMPGTGTPMWHQGALRAAIDSLAAFEVNGPDSADQREQTWHEQQRNRRAQREARKNRPAAPR